MIHARFQLVYVDKGLWPYVLQDFETGEVLVWCSSLKEGEIVKKDYNRYIEQERILQERFNEMGI